MIINIKIDVPNERIQSLIDCAFHGGSNYWLYTMNGWIGVVSGDSQADKIMNGASMKLIAERSSNSQVHEWELPDTPATYICLLLDSTKVERGLTLMAEKYPHHWADIMKENDDADTGDNFLQLALFGELVFG